MRRVTSIAVATVMMSARRSTLPDHGGRTSSSADRPNVSIIFAGDLG
jgi:hypothetical protein